MRMAAKYLDRDIRAHTTDGIIHRRANSALAVGRANGVVPENNEKIDRLVEVYGVLEPSLLDHVCSRSDI